MGVQGLWDLLAPVGRRVSVETLAGKRLAIDASIWMVQFVKAMRDEKGEMVRNAHLIGFFRRICKLLYLRTKPVFVFDGGTPALKRRTLAARRRHRDQARAKLRKTAEKLLLNHLKARKLEELAAEIKSGRQKAHDSKGKDVILSHDDDDTMQKAQDLEGPGDGIATEEGSSGGTGDHGGEARGRGSSLHENLDELLAASLAAEEEGRLEVDAEATCVLPSKDEGEDDEDEEMLFPIESDNVDPAVLASLPPSMQLDLLVQMRERVMAENRQKYQKLKKAPEKFSVLQIQSYLKTVAFRREIDQIQKHAAGRGLGGVQTSRIASEANREFIFSSSFTGDKEILSRGVAEDKCKDHDGAEGATISDKTTFVAPSNQSKRDKKAGPSELKKDFGPNVETYHDERGLFRVSRVRGLGIRMTRDLQRNLDMMKEHEHQKGMRNHCMNLEASRTNQVTDTSEGLCQNISMFIEDCDDINAGNDQNSTQRGREVLYNDQSDSIEISFLDDGEIRDTDDDLFLELVSRSPTSNLHSRSAPVEHSNNSESDNIWEDEVNEIVVSPKCLNKQIAGNPKCAYMENQSSLFEGDNSEEDKVEWEEGVSHDSNATSYRDGPEKAVSRGLEEEEANLQEAIRRSLEDFTETISSVDTTLGQSINNLRPLGFTLQDLTTTEKTCHYSDKQSGRNLLLQPGKSDVSKINFLQRLDSSGKRLDTQVLSAFESGSLVNNEGNVTDALKMQNKSNTSELENLDVSHCHISQGHHDTHLLQMKPSFRTSTQPIGGVSSNSVSTSSSDVPGVPFPSILDHCQQSRSGVPFRRDHNDFNADISYLVEETTLRSDKMQQQEKNVIGDGSSIQNSFDYQMNVTEAHLDEEISLLRQECTDLGNEQRKLERNAESVNSEMFAECQELLQMFGLPYIIAPMEAEAQCAYMELAKLVDGVVTDDSDVFLFGARSVYKNIFDDRKYVETYFMKDIENELGLNRETLIRMALLLGSDYTEGVSGIGIVNAIEVVHAFPEEDGLQKFREWIESPDLTIFGNFDSKIGSNSNRRSSKESNEDIGDKRFNVEGHASEGTDLKGHDKLIGHGDIKENFKSKHRNISKNWHIPPSFPSESVINAYTSPQVDESTETFTWGKPDLLLLRRLCWEKFGWTNKKSDELLGPVLEEYSKHETQLRLEAFFTFNERFAKIRSQRIKKALKGISGSLSSDLTDDVKQVSALQNKCETETSTVVRRKTRNKVSEESGQKIVEDVATDSHINEHSDQENNSALGKNRSGTERSGGSRRGRGRQRGRGRRSSTGRRSGKLETPRESSSESLSDSVAQKHKELPPRMCRKRVKYAEENFEELEEATSEQMTTGAAAEDQIVEDSCDLDVGAHQYAVDGSDEYLTSGGGFCVDDNDPEGEDRNGDDFKHGVLENDPPAEGLGWGDRFCIDENIDEHTWADPRPRGDSEICNQSNSDNAQNLELTNSERANIQTVSPEHSEGSRSPVKQSSSASLRAMPSLRKRRKL